MPAPLPPADGPRPIQRAAVATHVDALPPADRLTIVKRGDAIVVRVRSEGSEKERLPDAVFSFRCGDQYGYSGMMSDFFASRRNSPGAPAGTMGRRGITGAMRS